MHGAVHLTSPQQGSTLGLPEEMFVTVRISWSPAHVAIRFPDESVLRKITFRPWFGAPAFWTQGTYDRQVFTREINLATPLMFYIPGEIPAGAAKSKYAESTPADDKKPAEEQKSESESETEEWPNDWNDWHNDWNAWNSNSRTGDCHGQSEEKTKPKREARKSESPPSKVEPDVPLETSP